MQVWALIGGSHARSVLGQAKRLDIVTSDHLSTRSKEKAKKLVQL